MEKRLTRGEIETPLGKVTAAFRGGYLIFLMFSNTSNLKEKLERITKDGEETFLEEDTPPLRELRRQLFSYFSGDLKTFSIPLELQGTAFRKRVWEGLMQVEYGKTLSYKEQAESLGDINLARAVGQANGHNNILILVPCHRILASNGGLGGYSSGIERKKKLLLLEKRSP